MSGCQIAIDCGRRDGSVWVFTSLSMLGLGIELEVRPRIQDNRPQYAQVLGDSSVA